MTEVDSTRWPMDLVTLADWEAMGEDELHQVECSEGVLVVTPKPMPRHQRAMLDLVNALDAQLPADLVAVPDVDVLLTEVPLTVRAPDLLVTTRKRLLDNPPRFDAVDVRLAVEILSLGSRRMDRVTKASEYADAGIAHYWIVDLGDHSSVAVHRLAPGGGYQPVAEHHGGTSRLVFDDISVELDLDAL